MTRTYRAALLALALAGASIVAGAARGADQACTIATKGDSPVAKACAQGGIIDAKRSMRDLVKKGKGAGVRFECDDCHKNDTGYDLTPAARDNFKKLLAAVETRK
jgi:hypothetical protein